MAKELIVAIDTWDVNHARRILRDIEGYAGMVKIGLEFYMATGIAGFLHIALNEIPIFLDLKLHDVPNTVKSALQALMPLSPAMLTVHASGGPAMIRAAREAVDDDCERRGTRPLIIAVTALTSLSQTDLDLIGYRGTALQLVLRMGTMALESGADGLVCSPLEVVPLRQTFGPGPKLVVAGIRPTASPLHDQIRVATPTQAIMNGADYVVVGRPIIDAEYPGKVAADISAEIEAAMLYNT